MLSMHVKPVSTSTRICLMDHHQTSCKQLLGLIMLCYTPLPTWTSRLCHPMVLHGVDSVVRPLATSRFLVKSTYMISQ